MDLIIAEYPDGLRVPGVSKFAERVLNWNKHVQNFIKFTIGFCQGYFHDDGALLPFYHDIVQIKKEVLSFFYNNNLEVKNEWTIVNSLHITHPVHNSKRVNNFGNFSFFKFVLLHDLNHISNNSGPMVDIRTLKFKAIVLVRYSSTPLVRLSKKFVISSSDEFEDVDLASDDVILNIVTGDTAIKCNDADTFWWGPKEKAMSLLQLVISGLSPPWGIICDLTAGTGMSNLLNIPMSLDLGNSITFD